ncbi:M23 family metallopeptidase [Streptomyces liangshanensis]|uniref:M23 family metallopeptidase n=1 Tax=Streptomyces liangshanensis TaxID=2717324 RepID=UPI0036D7DBE7
MRTALLLTLTLLAPSPLTPPAAPVPATPATSPAVWPVTPASVVRAWDPPASPYGPGHRGIDLAAPPGTPVRAAAAGRVLYAGRVAGRGVLSITLKSPPPKPGAAPLRITYEPVDALVTRGTEVEAGELVARRSLSASHCATECLHWGLRSGDTYLNPVSLLPHPELTRPPPRLLPTFNVPLPDQ